MVRPADGSSLHAAARAWADACLLADGSILSDEEVWNVEGLEALERHFIQNPDAGEGSFLSKLEVQLAPTAPAAKKLAAELLWMLYLPVSPGAMIAETKRFQIRKVWEWSGEPFPESQWCVQDAVLEAGRVNPGPGFHTHRWREFRFFIDSMLSWKRLSSERRQALVDEPWAFADWLDEQHYTKGRQFRHLLLFLLFPDHFERVATAQHKRRILEVFQGGETEEEGDAAYGPRVRTDRALSRVRERLAASDSPVDFYEEPYASKWLTPPEASKSSSDGDPSATQASASTEWIRERFGDVRVWLRSAGEGGRLWREFRELGMVAVGWDYLGDLTEFETRDEVHAAIAEEENLKNPYNSSLAVWQFVHDMHEGDVVVVKHGPSRLLGWGVVTGPYRHDPARSEYRNVRSVKWEATGEWDLDKPDHATSKALTEMARSYPGWVFKAFRVMEGADEVDSHPPGEGAYTLADALGGLFLDPGEFSRILDALGRKKNVILQGPPGVGKTFMARRLAYALIRRKDRTKVEFVQFHQSYAYEDFIQGYRPTDGGGFTLRNGVFHRFCRQAAADPETPHVFIIDEINRANLSRVFGELMVLIEPDKRGEEHAIPLTYSPEERFHVPENLHLVGLMNTADRSLALVDYALRRRFTFIDLKPAFGSEAFHAHLREAGVEAELVQIIIERMRALNEVIRSDTRSLGPGFEIGHSYFVPGSGEEALDQTWYRTVVDEEIRPLLREYWFDDTERWKEQVARLTQ